MSNDPKARRADLTARIRHYLAKPRACGPLGEWPEVTVEDLEALDAIVDLLLACKYGRDDGDALPVDVLAVDRTRCEGLTCVPVPHLRADATNFAEVYVAVTFNLAQACDALQRLLAAGRQAFSLARDDGPADVGR